MTTVAEIKVNPDPKQVEFCQLPTRTFFQREGGQICRKKWFTEDDKTYNAIIQATNGGVAVPADELVTPCERVEINVWLKT